MSRTDGEIQLESVNRFDKNLKGPSPNASDSEPPAYSQISELDKNGKSNLSYIPDGDSQDRLYTTLTTVPSSVVGKNDVNVTVTEGIDVQLPTSNGLRQRKTQENNMNLDDDVEQHEESSDEDDEYDNRLARTIGVTRRTVYLTYNDHKKVFWIGFWTLLAALYFAYVIYAMVKTFDVDDEGSMRLLIVTSLGTVFVIGRILWGKFMTDIQFTVFDSQNPTLIKARLILYWCLVIGTTIFFISFIIVDVAIDRPKNLISAFGMFAFILVFFLFSKNPAKIPPNHLLSASVMSAPAALAMAKLFYPETKTSKHRAEDVYNMEKGKESNIIEAASNGASISISLIANIAVNLIAFIAILNFLDSTLIWMGHRVNMYDPELTFTLICSYLFYPVSWLLGTDKDDVRKVAGMIGTKTFLNEFVAYGELSTYIGNTAKYNNYISNSTGTYNGTSYKNDDIIINYTGEVLVGGILSDRSVVVATYALCGFSNISSIGIMLGALGALAPSRKKDITKVVVRAMIAGNVACFMTACIAGLLYKGPI